MDTSLFERINRFAVRTPWLHPVATAYATYGIVVFGGLILLAFWRARETGNLEVEAGAVWAGAAASVALGLGQIIGGIIDRRRPYENLQNVHVLVSRTTDFSLPSDHATAVGAVAVALLLVNRRIGVVASVLAVLMAATRVYAGAHYPSDVLAGLALGGAVAVVGAGPCTTLIQLILQRVARFRWAAPLLGTTATT